MNGRDAMDSIGPDAPMDDPDRVAWFDYAKGICILLVVMMHSTLGVGEAFAARGWAGEGFMHWIVAYAKPFRMPDFFMLSGLFLSLAIRRSWRHYLDKKVVHFAYFYLLWLVIQALVKTAFTSGLSVDTLAATFVGAVVAPYPTLWFIYVLPLFFVFTKLFDEVPAWIMLAGAAVLHTVPLHTGWITLDEFAGHYYVFFLGGYFLAPYVFRLAAWSGRNPLPAVMMIGAWAIINGFFAFTPSPLPGWQHLAELPVVSIVLGAAGAVAIVAIASLLARFELIPLISYCGANSIVLYISFTIPMAITRVVLLKLGVITDTGLASLIVWMVAFISPLVLHAMVRGTPLRFLYERPKWFRLPYPEPKSARFVDRKTLVKRRRLAAFADRRHEPRYNVRVPAELIAKGPQARLSRRSIESLKRLSDQPRGFARPAH